MKSPIPLQLTEFTPSDILVRLVQENLSSELLKNFRNEVELSKSVQEYISSSVLSYLTTVGRGLCRGQDKILFLTLNGRLTESILKGLFYRIPVGLQSKEDFSKCMCNDLMKAASLGLLNNQYAEVVLSGNELVLKCIKDVQNLPPSEWKKASMFITK